MAPTLFDRSFHPNTVEENEKILNKIASRKIDSRRPEELVKLFAQLNAAETSRSLKTSQNSSIGHQGLQRLNYGPVLGIPPGTWWGIRMDCSRDFIHVPFNEDIEIGAFGATSLCTSHSPSNDVDLGDFLTITGSEYSEEILENDPLLRSCKNNVPLRLIRSYNLSNKFAPKTGYRYDGLYAVVSGWIGVSNQRKNLKFALARLNYQEPPPWEPQETATLKKTRTKSKVTQRCHMDCCKTDERTSSKEKKLDNISIEKLSISKPQDKQPKDSTIVMRNVLKKSESIPGSESPILASPKSAGCKLQNTNISIRTDLYDSSPNPHQDVKRIPMTFCRIYKASKPQPIIQNKTSSTSSVGVLNLNVFGPGANNKIGESLIQMRSGTGKNGELMSPRTPVVFNKSSTENHCSSKNSEKLSEDSPGSSICLGKTTESSTKPNLLEKSVKSSCDVQKSSILKSKDQNSAVSFQNIRNTEKSLRATNSTELANDSASVSSHKPECSLSPDAVTPKSSKTEKPVGKNLYSLRSSSADKSKKIIEQSENNRKSIIRRSTITRSNKSEDSSRKEVKSKLKTSKKPVKTFSKASVKTKRQNELAKLVIDANFVTKIRGPRTRRFPYAMRGFSKRRDNLKHLKGRSNPKKTKILQLATAVKKKNTNIPQNRHTEPKTRANDEKGKKIQKKNETERISDKDINQNNETNETNNINKISEVNKMSEMTKIARINKINKIDKVSDKMGKSVSKAIQVSQKVKMVNASTQCVRQKDASTLINFAIPSRSNDTPDEQWPSLDEVKSEVSDDDDLEEVYYRNSSVQTTRETEIVRPNCVKVTLESSARLGRGLSAFVPVNMSDVDFRVARLRSIGFKPIHQPCFFSGFGESAFCEYRQENSKRKDVDEKYNKYTSEENNVVGYMDDELRYQDIEEEAEDGGRKRARVKGVKELKKTRILRKRKSDDEKVEEPWQGWKKLIQL